MQDYVLAKIGGSSLRGPECLGKCKDLLEKSPSIRAVVISATFNTTNLLEELAEKSINRDFKGSVDLLKELKRKHLEFAHFHNINEEVSVESLVLKAQTCALSFLQHEKFCKETMDSLYSIGELLSAKLFAAYLKKVFPQKEIHFFDAREVIATDSHFGEAIPLNSEINKKVSQELKPLINENSIVVVPGFIGRDLEGRTTTLGREGSDLTAALLASALNVGALHIYKDVAGIYSADPKIVPTAKALKELDFDSINTLSEFGAKVLFPRALAPVMEKEIEVFIGSTENPENGTKIVKTDLNSKFRGISLRSGFFRLDLEKNSKEASSENFKNNVLQIFKEQNKTPQNLFHSPDSVGLIFSSKVNIPGELKNHLREFCMVSQENRVSLLTIVGPKLCDGMDKVFRAQDMLYKEKISLTQIDLGKNFITFAFPSRFEEKVLNDLHHILFS